MIQREKRSRLRKMREVRLKARRCPVSKSDYTRKNKRSNLLSSTWPKFLFVFERRSILKFHSYSQEDPFSRHHHHVTTISPNPISYLSSPIRGLIFGQQDFSQVICNPTTGQIVTLPRVQARTREPLDDILHFLEYDPVNDQYKMLYMMIRYVPRSHGPVVSEEHQIFTLGATEKAWKKIECKHPHFPVTNQICRDGVIYYGASYNSHREGSVVMSFDVRSEDFGVTKLPEDVKIQRYGLTELVNYHGKMALVDLSYTGRFDLWVLQDVKKQEWSKISISLPNIDGIRDNVFYCKGAIGTGEIIFAPSVVASPFFLLYYDLKRNDVRRVDIEGVNDSDADPIRVFMDHVESPMFL